MDSTKYTLRYLETDDGKVPVREWLLGLDRAIRARVEARLGRIRDGNLGDYRDLGGGVHELRMAFGPGYRIYFALQGREIIILLCGGDKGTQQKDVDRARRLYEEMRGGENG